jgi:hypothetical protein
MCEWTCTEIFIYMWLALLMRPYSYLAQLTLDRDASRNERRCSASPP